jgi:CRP/FNR family transcriptional regulator, anaerobic regulatory protein
MPLTITEIQPFLPLFSNDLLSEIAAHSSIIEIPAGTTIVREGQYIKTIPIVLKGLVKVFAGFAEKELLLYYIEPKESCVMSFSAALMNGASRISAVTEEDSLLLLLPTEQLSKWLKQFPILNNLFYSQYNLRYSEMLDTINSLLFGKMDVRLHHYLVEKAKLKNTAILSITHKQIAAELGTAREVITRVMKRLEQDGKIKQTATGIEIL